MLNFKNKSFHHSDRGFITLLIMLIVSAVCFLLIISALQSSVNSSKSALAILQSSKARAYANTCIEEALYAIHTSPGTVVLNTPITPSSQKTDTGTCSYTVTSPDITLNPSTWTILGTGVENNVTVQISTNAILNNSALGIVDWNENTHGNSFKLNYTAGLNGSVDVNTEQTVNYGGIGPTVTATADVNYHFVSWSDGRTDNPRIDTNVARNISVAANFAPNTITLTYAAGANGTLIGNATQTINYGGDGSAVMAVGNTNYRFDHWEADNNITNPRTDTSMIVGISVTAFFVIDWTCGQALASTGGPYDSNGTTQVSGGYVRTVSIGTQCWTKDNLNVGTRISGATAQTNNSTTEKHCYNNLDASCTTYGGLYQWDEMMDYSTYESAQGICPTGWHIPSDTDWTNLTNYLAN